MITFCIIDIYCFTCPFVLQLTPHAKHMIISGLTKIPEYTKELKALIKKWNGIFQRNEPS